MLSGGGRRGMGGGIMRSIRGVRTGVGSTLSNSKTSISENLKTNSPTRSISISPNPLITRDVSEWEYIENETLFGSVPSRDEVHHALQQARALYCWATENSSDADDDEKRMEWYEPSQSLYNGRMLQRPASAADMAYEAFHLLETQPSVQKMVASLSCDEAVWKAVMNNDAVKELRQSIHQDRESMIFNEEEEEEEKGSPKKKNILKWIVMFAMEKMKQLLEKMSSLLKNNKEEDVGGGGGGAMVMKQRVKASVLMSIMVLIIVILNRANPNTIR